LAFGGTGNLALRFFRQLLAIMAQKIKSSAADKSKDKQLIEHKK
jgi:hypothetical protein